MTRTEERLRDALRASADRVSDDELQPLAEAPAPRIGRIQSMLTGRSWVPPLAAAASVALVAGVVVAAGGYLRHPNEPGNPYARTSGAPAFYVTVEGHGPVLPRVLVRSTATGAIVATVADPMGPGPHPRPSGSQAQPSNTGPMNTPDPYSGFMQAVDVATADDATYYVVYYTRPYAGQGYPIIETFHISATGQPSALTKVPGGTLSTLASFYGIGGLAVSPGNDRLAIAPAATSSGGISTADEILLIDTRTGSHTVWQGGLRPNGADLSLGDLSWTHDGRSLIFEAQWCYRPDSLGNYGSENVCAPGTVRPTRSFTQIRQIDTASAGGRLSGSRILLASSARYPTLGQAVISPDGASLSAVVLSGPRVSTTANLPGQVRLSVVRVTLATGRDTVLYRVRDPLALLATLTADSTGRYLILGHAFFLNYPTGWLDAGHLRNLPVEGGDPVAW